MREVNKYLYFLLAVFLGVILLQEKCRRSAYDTAKANSDSLRIVARALEDESERLGEKDKEIESLRNTVETYREDIRRKDEENKESDRQVVILQDSIKHDTSIVVPEQVGRLIHALQVSLAQKDNIIAAQREQMVALGKLVAVQDSLITAQRSTLDKYEVLSKSLTKSLDDAVNHQSKGFDKLAYLLGIATVVVVASITP